MSSTCRQQKYKIRHLSGRRQGNLLPFQSLADSFFCVSLPLAELVQSDADFFFTVTPLGHHPLANWLKESADFLFSERFGSDFLLRQRLKLDRLFASDRSNRNYFSIRAENSRIGKVCYILRGNWLKLADFFNFLSLR
jgi:hypothetical protein